MRFIIDTNIIFSGIYNLDSNAGKFLMLAIEEEVELIAPEYVQIELMRILKSKLKFNKDEIFEIISALPIEWIEEELYSNQIKQANKLISDEKDVPILACALALGMDIITGDKHIHQMKTKKVKVWELKKALNSVH